jgi:alpha-glucosidase
MRLAVLFEDPNYEDEAVAKDKDGKPMVDPRGNPQLERTKEFNLPAVHLVMNEMLGLIHSFNTASFPGSRVLIGETNTRNVDELIRWYGTPKKPEFDLPMDVQAGFINTLDVAMFRKRLIDAERDLGNVPLLVFDNHDRPGSMHATATAFTMWPSSASWQQFSSRVAVQRSCTTGTRSA